MSVRRVSAARNRLLWLLGAAAALVAFAILVGAAFGGSDTRLAGGITIAGVPVGGLTPQAADALLAARGAHLASVPVTFVSGSKRFTIPPVELGVSDAWAGAVATAQADGNGSGIFQGFQRLALSLFGTNIDPKPQAYRAAVDYEVGVLATRIDRPMHQARLVRRGLGFEFVPGTPGLELDRPQAAAVLISALASLSRGGPVALPVAVVRPAVSAGQLAHLRAQAALAVSAPVGILVGGRRFVVAPAELAPMLALPGSGGLVIGGAKADAYFARLQALVGRPAEGATWAASGSHIRLVPAQKGRVLDVPLSAAALMAAAEGAHGRTARLVVDTLSAGRSTAAAEAMGITGLVGSYETDYGGVANRIHNVQLVAHLLDGKLIPPGTTFSFNRATGARTAAKGFLVAPVIINGELSTGLGGGVCQVSTTVFNAAFVAGLPITDRTNHALYISHYPLGRDATVDYPDVDLRFVNDTPHWLLVRTFVGPTSLVVSLYGAPQHRRVVTNTAPLTATGPMPIAPELDNALAPGERVVVEAGMPPTTTTVQRWVYAPGGKLLSDQTWVSNYDAVPEVVLVGPRPRPTPAPSPARKTHTSGAKGAKASNTGTSTTSAPTQTTPSQTTNAKTTPSQTTTGPTAPTQTAPTQTAATQTAPAQTTPAPPSPPLRPVP